MQPPTRALTRRSERFLQQLLRACGSLNCVETGYAEGGSATRVANNTPDRLRVGQEPGLELLHRYDRNSRVSPTDGTKRAQDMVPDRRRIAGIGVAMHEYEINVGVESDDRVQLVLHSVTRRKRESA